MTVLLSQVLQDPGIDTGVGPLEVSFCHVLGDVGQVTSPLSLFSFPTKRDNNSPNGGTEEMQDNNHQPA